MFKFIKSLFGYIGWFNRTLKFTETHYADFAFNVMPGSIAIVRRTDGRGLSGMIQAALNSIFSHAEICFGSSSGMFEKLRETVSADGEVGKIIVTSLDRYGTKEYQIIVFTFPDLNPREFSILKSRVYSMVGEPYDYAAGAHVIIPFIEDPEGKFNCSELVAWAFMSDPPIRRVVSEKVDWRKATPADIFNYMIKNKKVKIYAYNFDLEEYYKTC